MKQCAEIVSIQLLKMKNRFGGNYLIFHFTEWLLQLPAVAVCSINFFWQIYWKAKLCNASKCIIIWRTFVFLYNSLYLVVTMKTCVNPITRTNVLISTVAHNLEYSMGYSIVLHK